VAHPKGFVLFTAKRELPPQPLGRRFVVRANFLGHKKAKMVDLKIVQQKFTQLISRHLVQKTGYEAGTGILRLLGKASNTGFSRHIKTGCKLPVCITTVDRLIPF